MSIATNQYHQESHQDSSFPAAGEDSPCGRAVLSSFKPHPSQEQESLIHSLNQVCFKSTKDSTTKATSWQNLISTTEPRYKHNCLNTKVQKEVGGTTMLGSGSTKSSSMGSGSQNSSQSTRNSGSNSGQSGSSGNSGASSGFSNWFFKGQSDKNTNASFSNHRTMNTWMPTSM